MAMNEKGQMILLFSAGVVVIILSLSYLYAQNIIAGIESSRTMLAFPKEEIRNLVEIQTDDQLVIDQIEILCAKNGWVCRVSIDKVEFKNVEVDYCEGNC
ncbi:MAG: hypothetical protein NZ872_01965 [Archaeoglobaceae archaeon]|nr:hypothetical protein [Archaeoglobaceae archaeon]MDW8127964.1 hypothetical protein [Archaeoglobaceae archaeon]